MRGCKTFHFFLKKPHALDWKHRWKAAAAVQWQKKLWEMPLLSADGKKKFWEGLSLSAGGKNNFGKCCRSQQEQKKTLGRPLHGFGGKTWWKGKAKSEKLLNFFWNRGKVEPPPASQKTLHLSAIEEKNIWEKCPLSHFWNGPVEKHNSSRK